jgi:hypothetical protein
MLGKCRVPKQLGISRVVLSSMELVISNILFVNTIYYPLNEVIDSQCVMSIISTLVFLASKNRV